MATDNTVLITDFRAGLVSDLPPAELPPGACADTLNAWPTATGALGVRRGVEALHSSAYPPLYATLAVRKAGGVHYLGVGASQVYAGNPSTGLSQISGYTASNHTDTALFGQMPAALIQYGGKFFVMTQAAVWELTESSGSWSLSEKTGFSPSPPGATMSAIHHSYLFTAGDGSYPNRVSWCKLFDPLSSDSWPATSYIDVGDRFGGPITGLASSLDGYLFVACQDSIFGVQGYGWDTGDDLVVQELHGLKGCVAPQTVKATTGGVFYVGNDGVYVAGQSAGRISDPVANHFRGRNLSKCTAIVTNDLYGVTIPHKTVTDQYEYLLVYDRRHKTWSKWDVVPRNQFDLFVPGSCPSTHFAFQDVAQGQIWTQGNKCADDTVGTVYPGSSLYPETTLYPGGGAGTAAVRLEWTSGQMTPSGDPFMQADIPEAWLAASTKQPVAVDVTARWDYGTEQSETLVMLEGDYGSEDVWRQDRKRVGGLGKGHTLELGLVASVTDDFAVEAVSLLPRPYRQ